MNELKIFDYEETPIRVVEINNAPWWVAKDVCDVFGATNYRRLLSNLDDDEKGVSQMNTPGGKQKTTIINESGLYSLLFAMQPEKARGVSDSYIAERQAKLRKFKRWVTHEVLPEIRKTGGYNAKAYPPKATSVGEIVNLIRVTRETMQAQGCKPEDIAKAVKDICDQFGVTLPKCFVKPKEMTMKDVDDMFEFVYMPRPKGAKQPSYEDFLAWQAVKKLGYEGR